MASDVSSNVGEQVFNNEVRRKTVADITSVFKNRRKGTSVTEVSSVSGCTTENEPNKESTCVIRSRSISMSTEKSSKEKFLLRRQSTMKSVAQSITGLLRLRKLTVPKTETIKPKIKYENTFKLSPDPGDYMVVSKIERMVEQVLRDEIGNTEYNMNAAGQMACILSTKIKKKVKEANLPRYRVISQVVIAEVKEQGLESASRCLWDASTDNFTTVTYKNDSVAAIAMIYCVYYE